MTVSLPPLSLYIHIPWCERKCPYCDFNSHENFQPEFEQHYIQCLLEDLQNQLGWVQGRKLQSIFIGGGTPSIFSAKSIHFLLNEIQKHIEFSTEIEITLEANPASSQGDYFFELSESGVNRVSLGVQSFQAPHLTSLGRLHSRDDAQAALEALSRCFSNFNIDLMFGLPAQTLEQGMADLKQALQFSPAHISWYQLTIEPNTVFYRNTPRLPEEHLIDELHQAGIAFLAQQGFAQYEVSAFSKPEKHSVHNLNYWHFGDYLAIGAGAHGKITHIENDALQHLRFQLTRLPKDYMARVGSTYIAKQTLIPTQDLPLEYLMNTLRLNEAVSFKQFEQATGLKKEILNDFLAQAQQKQLVEIHEHAFQKTSLGARYLDTLLTLVE